MQEAKDEERKEYAKGQRKRYVQRSQSFMQLHIIGFRVKFVFMFITECIIEFDARK